MIVTVLLWAGIVPGTMNCLQVMAEIQETRSKRSVFGLRFSFRRFPSGSLRHESPVPGAAAGPPARSAARAAAGGARIATSSSSAASFLPMHS